MVTLPEIKDAVKYNADTKELNTDYEKAVSLYFTSLGGASTVGMNRDQIRDSLVNYILKIQDETDSGPKASTKGYRTKINAGQAGQMVDGFLKKIAEQQKTSVDNLYETMQKEGVISVATTLYSSMKAGDEAAYVGAVIDDKVKGLTPAEKETLADEVVTDLKLKPEDRHRIYTGLEDVLNKIGQQAYRDSDPI